MLLNPPHMQFLKTTALNPATLLPDDDPRQPLHDCLEVLENVTCTRPDLMDSPWPNPDDALFTDGSSFVSEGVRAATNGQAGISPVPYLRTSESGALQGNTPRDETSWTSTGGTLGVGFH